MAADATEKEEEEFGGEGALPPPSLFPEQKQKGLSTTVPLLLSCAAERKIIDVRSEEEEKRSEGTILSHDTKKSLFCQGRQVFFAVLSLPFLGQRTLSLSTGKGGLLMVFFC